MANGSIVDSPHPVHVDQTACFNGIAYSVNIGDAQFEAPTTSSKVEPIPHISGLVICVVPCRNRKPSEIAMYGEALPLNRGVLGHGEPTGRER